jgi:hypothetical protein
MSAELPRRDVRQYGPDEDLRGRLYLLVVQSVKDADYHKLDLRHDCSP